MAWLLVVLTSCVLGPDIPSTPDFGALFVPEGQAVEDAADCPVGSVPFSCDDVCEEESPHDVVTCEDPVRLSDWYTENCLACALNFEEGAFRPFNRSFH